MARHEVYVSVDVESDGPVPGLHSMLALGAAAFVVDGSVGDETARATFAVTLDLLEGAAADPATTGFWRAEPLAWAEARRDPQPIGPAMAAFDAWLADLPGEPVCVAAPVGFDFAFLRYYLIRFVGQCRFGHRALDVASFAMAHLGTNFTDTQRRAYPPAWRCEPARPHVALDDAIAQGVTFVRMLRAARASRTLRP